MSLNSRDNGPQPPPPFQKTFFQPRQFKHELKKKCLSSNRMSCVGRHQLMSLYPRDNGPHIPPPPQKKIVWIGDKFKMDNFRNSVLKKECLVEKHGIMSLHSRDNGPHTPPQKKIIIYFNQETIKLKWTKLKIGCRVIKNIR